MSLASNLPTDVLYCIFLCIYNEGPFFSEARSITTVSHVCRQWRFSALTLAFLWTQIRLRCVRFGQIHPWAMACLERSRNCKITLALHAFRHLYTYELQNIFKAHGHRIRSLNVKVVNNNLTPILWPQLVGMSSLEDYSYEVQEGMVVKLQRDTPKSQKPFPFPPVHRNAFYTLWRSWDSSSLTSISLHYVNEQDAIKLSHLSSILSHCRHTLRHFSWIGFAPLSRSTDEDLCAIELPVLDSLYLGYFDNIYPLAQLLRTPNLRSLTIRNILVTPDFNREVIEPFNYRDPPPQLFASTGVPAIFSLFHDAAPNISHLAIFGEFSPCLENEFMHFLVLLHSIESITLYNCGEDYYISLMMSSPAIRHVVEEFDGEDDEALPVVPTLNHVVMTDLYSSIMFTTFLRRRIKEGLPPLRKATITVDCLSRIEFHGLLPGLMACVRSISTVTDPINGRYAVYEESEIDVVVDGVVVKE